MTGLYTCPSVAVGDWFQGPRGYQNSQVLKFLVKNGIVIAGKPCLHTGCSPEYLCITSFT